MPKLHTKSKPRAAVAMPSTADPAAFAAAVQAEAARLLAERAASAEAPKPIELPADLQPDRLIGAEPAAAMFGYSLAHFRRLYRAGKIPPPVKINGRKVGWRAGGLRDFIASREAAA